MLLLPPVRRQCRRQSLSSRAAVQQRSAAAAAPIFSHIHLPATLHTLVCRFPEMYMLSGPPFRLGKCSRGRPVVVDRSGDKVGLLGDAWAILQELSTEEKWAGTQIAYVSRTDEPGESVRASGGRGERVAAGVIVNSTGRVLLQRQQRARWCCIVAGCTPLRCLWVADCGQAWLMHRHCCSPCWPPTIHPCPPSPVH